MHSQGFIACRLLVVFLLFHAFGYAQTYDTLSLYFAFNSETPLSYQPLDSAFASMKYKERAAVLGYADFVGTGDYNAVLSKKRASVVAKYVVKNSQGKLQVTSIKGNGELPGKVSESEEGDALSRRVDVIIMRENIIIDKPIEPEALEISVKEGESLVLEGMTFIPGRHYPVPEARPVLMSLLKAMQENPKLEIEIQGHICCIYDGNDGFDPDTRDNLLSENRARFVFDFLVENGIDPLRMSFVGKASREPKIHPEITEADKQANRRVEILIVKS